MGVCQQSSQLYCGDDDYCCYDEYDQDNDDDNAVKDGGNLWGCQGVHGVSRRSGVVLLPFKMPRASDQVHLNHCRELTGNQGTGLHCARYLKSYNDRRSI